MVKGVKKQMITYQDLLETGENIKDKLALIERAIAEHKTSSQYKTAVNADLYYAHQNPTIMRYEKIIRDMYGRAVKDTFSANHKIASRYYFFFVTQLVQYLLSNGASFQDESIKEKIKNFDEALSKLATNAQNHGVSYGFFNLDRIDVFALTEFVPFYDEENGFIRAGVRFWQIADDKPLRITLYEEDGYTEYIKRVGEDFVELQPKRAYKQKISVSVTGTEISDGENYPAFPVVPLYNINKQSELVGNQATIDAYDLVASKMTNNISEGDLIYWLIHNADGMTIEDDQKLLQMLRVQHIGHTDEGQIEAKTIEIPHEATDSALERLRKQLFDDFMGFDPAMISAGSVTATQITAAYQQLDNKADMFEYQVIEFIKGILAVAGMEGDPSFKRNRIANVTEETQTILSASAVLDEETIIRKLPFLTPEEAEQAIEKRQLEEMDRYEEEESEPVEEEQAETGDE